MGSMVTRVMAAAAVVGVLVGGCAGDKMMSGDKMSGDKMGGDKMMGGDKAMDGSMKKDGAVMEKK